MKAMILAAGRGERMRPLTNITPKPLLKVGDKSLIVWTIARLRQAGIIDLVVNVSHLAEHIECALGDGVSLGVHIQYSREQEALETAGGIAWALPLLDEKPFLVVNSDVYTNYDFSGLRERGLTLSMNQPAHLVLVDNPDHHPQGDFGLHEGVVTAGGARLTFSGIGAYHPSLFAGIARGDRRRLAAQLATPIAEGRVTGEHFHGDWNDIGTPQRLAALAASLRAD